MIVFKAAITHLASRGRTDIQVPEINISTKGVLYARDVPNDTEELPDAWFIRLSYYLPVIKGGFLYLSKAGWEANKNQIKIAFEKAIVNNYNRGKTWDDFINEINKHFIKIENTINKKKKYLIKQLEYLNSVKI